MGVAETTLKNRRRGRLKVVLIVLLVLLVFGTPGIIYFRISADGRIDEILELKGSIKITSYDIGNRVVTGFIYTTGSYQVIYTYDKTTGGSYRVNYIFRLFDFAE